MISPKTFIKSLYNKRAKNDANTKTLANSLRTITRESLAGSGFIKELLQNADDALALSGNTTVDKSTVDFVLTTNFLVIKHNGKAFDQQDVSAIADSASTERNKISNINQTGNKGIGFKAVFNLADYVLIDSGSFSFRFDKNHETWQANPNDYPWEIIPIWTEQNEFPAEVKKFMGNNKVTIILKLKNKKTRDEINEALTAYCQEAKHLLFLRATRGINFQNKNTEKVVNLSITQEKNLEKGENIKEDYELKHVTTTTSNQLKDTTCNWYVFKVSCQIPPSLKTLIKDSDAVPEKYKQSEKCSIQIAIEFNGQHLLPASGANIYCFFATEIKSDLTCVINADFVLDMARATWQNNAVAKGWNQFLLTQILLNQFVLLKHIALHLDQWRSIVPMLILPDKLPKPNNEAEGKAKGQYDSELTELFEQKIKETVLIKNCAMVSCQTIPTSIVDSFNFIADFGSEQDKAYCTHSEMEEQQTLVKLGATDFDLQSILASIKKPKFGEGLLNLNTNKKFIEYLVQLENRLSLTAQKEQLKAELRELPFILTQDNKLEIASAVNFPSESLTFSTQGCTFIQIVHQELLTSTKIKTFLQTFDVKQLTRDEIVKRANSSNNDELIKFTQTLIDYQEQLKDEDWKSLSQLKLITSQDRRTDASTAYLANSYEPTLKLEDFDIDYQGLITDQYLQGENAPTKVQAKQFFVKLGVKQNLAVSNIYPIIACANEKPEKLIAFTRHLFDKFFLREGDQRQLFDKQLKKALSGLKLKTTAGCFQTAEKCYLADGYDPEMSIQTQAGALSYVSLDYSRNEQELITWRSFFEAIGVASKIELLLEKDLEATKIISLYPIAEGYLNELLTGEDEDGQEYCPSMARRYTHQHSLSIFFHCKFISEILPTPVFWQVIKNHWATIKESKTMYSTRISNIKVPNSIIYFVEQCCEKAYVKKPTELYIPQIKTQLGDLADDLPIAEIANGLEPEQLAYFKFQTILSVKDGLSVLEKLGALPTATADTVTKISFVYQHLVQALLVNGAGEGETHKSLKLLSQANYYKLATELYALISEKLELSVPNANLLKRPQGITLAQFLHISQLLNVTPVRDSDLSVTVTDVKPNIILAEKLRERIIYMGLVQAHENDKDTDDASLQNFLTDWFTSILEKLKALNCFEASQVSVCYKGIINESVSVWLSDNTLYMNCSLAGPKAQRAVYAYLHEFLKLEIGVDNLWELMDTPLEMLGQKFTCCTEDALSHAQKCLDSLQEKSESSLSQTSLAPASSSQASTITASTSPKRTRVEFEGVTEKDEDVAASVSQATAPISQSSAANESDSEEDDLSTRVSDAKRQRKTPVSTASSGFFRNYSSGSSSSQAAPMQTQAGFTSQLTSQQKKSIGYQGEKHIYERLKARYEQRFKVNAVDESYGFKISTETIEKQVHWLNKDEESGEQYDIKVITYKDSNPIKNRYLEVKTTSGNENQMQIYYSLEELSKMRTIQENTTIAGNIKSKYRLWCVRNIFGNSADIKADKIKNPEQDKRVKTKDMKQMTIQFNQ